MKILSFATCILTIAILGVDSHHWNALPMRHHLSHGYPRTQQITQTSYEAVRGTLAQLNEIDAQWICTDQKSGDMIVIGTDTKNGNTGNGFPGRSNVGPWPQQPTYYRYPPYQPQQPIYQQYNQQPVQSNNPQQQAPQYNAQAPQIYPPHNLQAPLPPRPVTWQPQQPDQPQQPQQPNQSQQPQQPNQPQQPQQPEQTRNPSFVDEPRTPWPIDDQTKIVPIQSIQTTTDKFKILENFDWATYVTTTTTTEAPKSSDLANQVEFTGEGLIDTRIG